MNVHKYTYRVIWSEEDQEHVGLCAEFPSLSHASPSLVGALIGIVTLVDSVVGHMSGSSETAPQPFSLRDFKGRIVVRVPPHLHRSLAVEAAEQGVSLNRWIGSKLGRTAT